jgi:hypothetical protein
MEMHMLKHYQMTLPISLILLSPSQLQIPTSLVILSSQPYLISHPSSLVSLSNFVSLIKQSRLLPECAKPLAENSLKSRRPLLRSRFLFENWKQSSRSKQKLGLGRGLREQYAGQVGIRLLGGEMEMWMVKLLLYRLQETLQIQWRLLRRQLVL